jgi:hypothetical protein
MFKLFLSDFLSFLFAGSLSEMRTQIGEAVPPLLGFAVARIIKSVLHSPHMRMSKVLSKPKDFQGAEG